MISNKTNIMMIISMGFVIQGLYADDAMPVYEKIPMRYPQLQEIQKRTNEIKHEFLMSRIKQYGFQGLALVAATLACYRTYQWLTTDKSVAKVTFPLVCDVALPNHEVRLQKLEEQLSPSVEGWAWIKQKGGPIAEMIGTMAAAHVIWNKLGNYLSQDLFHPDHGSVRWFASNKTSFLTVMEELKQYVLVLDGSAMASPKNKEMYDYFIISAINSAVIHLESIIGFIDYKQSLVTDDLAIQMAQISRYLFNSVHQFCQDVDALLARDDIEPSVRKAKMESMVNELRGEVARIVISFARIEAEQGI